MHPCGQAVKMVVGFTLGVEVRHSGMEAPSTQPPAKNSLDPHLLRCLYPPDSKRRWNEFISGYMDDRQGEELISDYRYSSK